jgi:hypothetical protein
VENRAALILVINEAGKKLIISEILHEREHGAVCEIAEAW